MGLNLSNAQIAPELGLNPDDVQRMTGPLREGIVARQPEPILAGVVECDEGYVVAGHKGRPDAVKKRSPGAAAATEGRTGPGHSGAGETTDFRHDPTGRRGGHPDAGEGPTSDDPSADPDLYRPRNARVYR